MDSQGLIQPPNPRAIKSLTRRVWSYGYLEIRDFLWRLSLAPATLGRDVDNEKATMTEEIEGRMEREWEQGSDERADEKRAKWVIQKRRFINLAKDGHKWQIDGGEGDETEAAIYSLYFGLQVCSIRLNQTRSFMHLHGGRRSCTCVE